MTEPAAPALFEGHYTFSRDDYLALVNVTRRSSWRLRAILVVMWLAVFVLIMGLTSESWTQFTQALHDIVTFNEVPFFVYLPLLAGLVLIAIMPSLTMLRAMRLYGGFAIADQDIAIVLDEAGVTTTGPGRQARMEWSYIKRVIVRPSHLFLAISKREAVVVPRRAFASEAEFVAVTALALRKVPKVEAK
jgi:hypothetical protein